MGTVLEHTPGHGARAGNALFGPEKRFSLPVSLHARRQGFENPQSKACGKKKGFLKKSFRKASILIAGPGRERPGVEKSTVFN